MLSLFILFVTGALLACGSGGRSDPRETVKNFFTAIRESDSLFLAQHVDMPVASATLEETLAVDSVTFDTASALLGALTGEGRVRSRWLENQIVLGKSQTMGDTAWVEVSFIDRQTRVQYYNKMRLEFRTNRWVINSFRTL